MHGFSSVRFSHSDVSDSLWPHGLQQATPRCPSPISRVYSNSSIELVMLFSHLILCPPLLLLPSIFPSIRVFSNESALSIRWPKYWGSASTSVLPRNIQDWSPLGWTGWISLQSKGLSRVVSNTTVQILWCSAFFTVQLAHLYMTTGKTIALIRWTIVDKVMSLILICCLGW